MEVFELRYHI